jgi:hypothetical protein
MDSKIFLGKYRVSAAEIEAVREATGSPLAYEGEEIDSGKTVVLEVVPAASLKMAGRQKLEAEAIAAKELRHVNIFALHDFGVEDNHLVYVTEEFEGTLAEEWVNMHGPMPVGPVLRIASQVVSALGAAAFYRIAHHAINPSNLVLVPGQTAEGEWPLVKVLHFVGGTAKFPGTAVDKSLHYASPEQLQHGIVDFRSEIYSLGCTMWFLLTGAPPLIASNGSKAVQPAKTGPDMMTAVPQTVRRLLEQMLSVNPDARPRDPLAFYRRLQDCLAQVEQREIMAGIARSRSVDMPARRRSPLKTLARAAFVLAMAALTAFVLREYLRHRRVVHAEEPIGVSIGITEASPFATPIAAKGADTMVSIVTQPTPAVVESESTESDSTQAPGPATDSVENNPANQVAAAPVQPATSDTLANPQLREPVPVTENNLSNPPPAINLSEVTSASQIVPQTTPKKTIMHEVRRAEPAEEEVTPAEPAPPGEGPNKVAPGTTASADQQRNSVTQTEQRRDVEGETKTRSRNVTAKDSEPTVLFKVPRKKTEQTTKSKRRADEIIYIPQPVR